MPTTRAVTINIKADSSQWCDMVYEVMMYEYNVTVAEQAAERLAEEFYRKSYPVRFINWERVNASFAINHLINNQPNEYLEKLVKRKFSNKIQELEARNA